MDSRRLQQLGKMATQAEHVKNAIRPFIKTAQLDVGGVLGTFRDAPSASSKKSH